MLAQHASHQAAQIARALCVDVAEHSPQPRLLADPDSLAYRAQIADAPVDGAEVTIVRVVDPVERRGDPRQLDDLLGGGVVGGT